VRHWFMRIGMNTRLTNIHFYEQAQALAVLHERQRLARELHDSLSQVLYSISLEAQSTREALIVAPIEAITSIENVVAPHISQFTETKNRIDKRQGQADEAPVDEEVAVPRVGFAIVIPCEYEEDQSPQNTERSSAWSGGQSAC